MRRVVLGSVVLALLLAGCSADPTASEEYRELESQLADVQQQLDEMTVARDELAGQVAAERNEPFDLDAFAAAWGSGDADQVRAFYTDDAVMMPFGHILATLDDHPMPEYWDVSGPDMDREALEHEGGTLEFFGVEQIGNMVVATAQWTFPQEGTVIKTTDIWHMRDGKIWRHFTDFEVYVNGELIDM